MRKRKSLVAALAVSLLLQGVTANLTVDKAYAERVRSESMVQMSSEKEVVNLTSFSKKSKRTENFNEDWKFYLGDASNAESLSFDDSKWTGVNLPHDYSIHQEFNRNLEAESGYLPGGIGWYRKHFSLTSDMQNKEFRLDFDGVYMDATVWVNGYRLGSHPYGYTPFSFDLTKHLKFDGTDNVVTVKVNHQTPSSRWYSGSGIYRDVKLQIMNKVHVGLNGVKIETPELANEQTNVKVDIKAKLVNALAENKDVKVKAKIFKKGSETEVIGSTELESTYLKAGAVSDISLSLTANSPALWDTENPNLYTVRVEVMQGEEVIDTYDSDYGFRWFSADKDKGTYLNGKPVKLKGVCMHHDQGALGAAAYKRATERQVEILQNMGCNSIRVTHNPASQVLIDICNEKGILLIEEMFDGWMNTKNRNYNDYSKWFNKRIEANNEIIGGNSNMTWAEFDLRAAIARGQNAPAIVMWSIGNEIQQDAPGGGYKDKAKELIKWGKEADNTRMFTIGSNDVKGGYNDHIDIGNQLTEAGGMSGTNYSAGWSYDDIHKKYPNWLLYGSETASSVNSRGVYTYNNDTKAQLNSDKQLTSYDHSKVGWGALASEAWYDVITRDFVAGEYVWTGFDYIGEPTPANGTVPGAQGAWPSPKNSYFGIIDTAGFPKDSYYFYQSQWNDKKRTLHVLPAWNEDVVQKSHDGKVKVVVYSDAAEVELKLNGKSQGKKKFKKNITGVGYKYQTVEGESGHKSLYMTWEVPFEAGKLEAVAYDESGNIINNTDGRSVINTTNKAVKLKVSADRTGIKADGKDLSYITVDVTDEAGNTVPNANNEITFSVEGEGKIVGVDNGSSPDHTPYNSLRRKVHAGKVLAIVKSNKKAGKITVKAKAVGLAEAKVDITAEAVQVGEETKVVEGFLMSKNYYVKKGNLPVLPEKIVVRYSDGTNAEKNVVWDKINEELVEQDGTFTVAGMVENNKVSVYVTMIDEIGGLLNYSTATPKGKSVKLPESRPAVLMNGTILNVSFPVTWDEVTADKYETAGVIAVNGKANVLGKEISITANIRVLEEELTLGSNMTKDATLSQNIPADKQSDNLQAIKDGSTTIGDSINDYNSTVWTNYKYSQEGKTKAEIIFSFLTQTKLGKAVIHFGKDNWAMRYPDKETIKFQISETGADSDWKDVEVKETIGTEKARVTPYTYDFSPITATYVKLLITNSAKPKMKAHNCTGITEVELLGVTSSFNVGSEAKLASLTVNDEALSPDVLASGRYETPAQVVELKDITTVNNAAYTVLPVYNNEVKILIESEDHNTRETFVIKLDKEVNEQAEELREYPKEKITATAGSELNPANGNEGPASYAIDGKLDTHWHTDWRNGKKATTEESRTISLELEGVEEISEFWYHPRTYYGSNGFITDYRIEAKALTDNTWNKVADGKWQRGKTDWYKVKFDTPVKTNNIRLVGVHTYADSGNDQHASVGELKLMLADNREKIEEANSKLEIEGLNADGKIAVDVVNEKHPVMPKVKVTREGTVLRRGIDYKVKYSDNTAAGTAKVEITGIIKYNGKLEKTFEIVQNPKRVETIFVAENPKKTIYKVGERFEAAGLELLIRYSDETAERISFNENNKAEFTFKPSQDEALSLDDKKVKVTYQGKEAEIDIVVEENKTQNNNNVNPVVPTVEETKPATDNSTTNNSTTDKPVADKPSTETETKPETTTEITEDSTPEGAVRETAFTTLVNKLNKNNKTKALSIQKKINRTKGLTLEQFAKELVSKKVIIKANKKDVKKFLAGVKTSKWAKSYVAALVKTGVLKKSDLKNAKKKISEEFAAKILEKLMVKAKK